MNFLTPLAFGLAALLPVIVALYFLKLRREEQPISSTYLWRTLVRDTAANAPWQRLKPNLLLLLQLLFLLALILALARPFTWSASAAGSHLILVVDTSASMGATDIAPNRLGQAVATARQLVESLPGSSRVTVIQAGAQVRVPVSGATEKSAAVTALESLQPGIAGADFASALTIAAAIAAREPDSEIAILSDGHITLPDNMNLPGRVRFFPIGNDNNNQALGALTLQSESSGRRLSAFVQVANYAPSEARRRLVLYADGQLIVARDVPLAPGKAQALTLPDLPPDARVVEARLEGHDDLAADDHAWAVPTSSAKVAVRLVSTGNRFLETALHLLPNVEVTTDAALSGGAPSSGDTPPSAVGGPRPDDLTIFDSTIPTSTLPSGSLLFIAPLRSTEFFSVTGQLQAPVPVSVLPDDPLLRYVDWRDVAIQDATRLALPAWGHAVIADSKTNAPLLVAGEQNGRRLAVLAFDLRHSDLPLRVAFPILVANLVDALIPGGASGLPSSVEPGRPLSLTAPPQANALAVQLPDGQVRTLRPANGQAVFDETNETGVYQVSAQEADRTTRPLGRFVVNLFSANESDITPRAILAIAGEAQAGGQELPRARDEWWRPLAWAALALLIFEWLYAYRGQVVRLVKRSVRRET